MNKILIKKANKNILKELDLIGFDKSYKNVASLKYKGELYKIFNLKPHEANILKQLCLSLGFDCAVSRNTVTCNCDKTDALIFATITQIDKLIKKLRLQPFNLKKLAEELQNSINNKLEPLEIKNTIFDWSRPYVMGILNITPDSFSDGGKYNTKEKALSQAIKMIEDGADIIDIGGESTRPNAIEITASEEIKRVVPIIKAIKKENDSIPISIDTRNAQTAQAAVEAGANIINDVSGLEHDKALTNFVCANNIPTVVMHSNSVPAISNNFTDNDIVEEIYIDLYNKVTQLEEQGLNRKNIIVDVGIGFGKNKEASYEILKRIEEFKTLNLPILLGISRKSFIKNEFNIDNNEADIPTALYTCLSSLNGVNIHRVHNVKLTRQFLNYALKLF